ncbi:tetratricopeptide repeat protein [Aliiglaciecola sp. LCG003]|uniref:tetratricopeptide repeat protein n=1 Tax=Aliiglaciecola sp. LCG003 TaxID=3053655 RepID=UPI00257307EC|nr:tetratricopeptide repeat protein [Aliiglaciecola sp. LCG003]WJG08345.1 tetratricopeptide repeat protein [Aliiglaciecola sp. LCG003]
MKKFVKNVTAIATITAAALLSNYATAQSAPVVCADYKRGNTSIVGERTGKKIQKALDAYNNDLMKEALEFLYDIDAKDGYDRAFTDNFIGKMLAGQDDQGAKALQYLKNSVNPKSLNDLEHAGTLRLVADLSMQEKEYAQSVEYYQKWMDYTCKEDADVYTRLAQAYYELKQLPKMVEPADKAIALYAKPNKNPYVLKLQSFYERKMYKETVAIAEELVRVFPDNKQWWSQLGFFYMLVEDYKKALSTFEIAYNQGYLSKKSEIKALSQLYATNEIPYKAAVIQEKYMKSGLLEKDDKALANLANSWHQARDYKKAAGYYAQAAQVRPDPDYFRKQGILLLAAEDYKGAINALQKALDEGADQQGRIHIAMMEAHIYTGNFKQAMVHVREAKKEKNVERTARAWEPYIKEKAKNRGIKV